MNRKKMKTPGSALGSIRRRKIRRLENKNALAFEKLEERSLLTGAVVINELLYNAVQGSDYEFIELYNQLAVDVDISRWSLADGIDFTFPQGTVIGGGEFLVVAADPTTIGVAGVLGPYSGSASNSGETIELRDRNDRLIDQLEYEDSGLWPVAADGSGASLSKIETNLATDDPASWSAISVVGGTPGAENTFNFGLPAINEVQAVPGDYQIEVHNGSSQTVSLSGYVLTQSGSFDHQHTLSGNPLVPANGYYTIDAQSLGFTPAVGDKLFLSTPGENSVADAVDVTGTSIARATPGSGQFQIPNQSTFGSANTFSFRDEIVINEIQYHNAPQFGVAAQPTVTEQTTPVAFDSVWRYNESGTDLGTDWAQSAHAVGGNWQQGAGLLEFENDALPFPTNTDLSDPASNSPFVRTYYFETEFSLTSDELEGLIELNLSHLVDDGAVFHINGVEFNRFKIGGNIGDPVEHSTLASSGGEAVLVEGVSIPIANLVVGLNRLSVEVHQASTNSSDVVMGAEVTASFGSISNNVPYAENGLEWIELYNRSNQAVNVAGWELDDAVRFDFPATTIAAGGYLVVTNDRAAFLTEYPDVDPSIVLGDFDGKLGNQSERILLLDDVGNTADEVTYFDGGRWAGAADGGGSTLELLDSDSNNSVAEAWAASDESSKSPWVTYTYTGTAGLLDANNYPDPSNGTGGSGNQTTEFNEFIFGLLDSGEVLLDDLSVIENPNGSANELLQDGTFESNNSTSSDPRLSVDTYRVLGTHGSHGLTGVVTDPDDPNNKVFRLVATGGADHIYNHVETTFANNAPIVDGREYQISFRAKWISGTPLLNTRLYFNKVAKTTTLQTPDAAGTPGAANSVAVVNAGPTFTNFEQTIAVPEPGQSVQIIAAASDNDGVASMTLFYSVDEGSYQTVSMTLNSDGQYVGSIPGQSLNSVVQFYVQATDTLGATSTYPAEGADSRALFKVLGLSEEGSEVVVDDFSGDLADWTSTVILDDNGGGSNTSTWTTNSNGQLELTTTSYNGIEQLAFIHDGLELGVGQEIRLDVSIPVAGNRNLGLYVGGTEPTTGIRRDYITVYSGANNVLNSRGADGTSQYGLVGANASGATQVFIAQVAPNVFEAGFYSSSGGRVVITTRNPSFANDATFVGIYADVRSTGTIGVADNLTLATIGYSGTPTGAPSFRIIMTESDRAFLHDNTNVSSNDGIGATVVYNNTEVYHNVYVRLKSSLRGRWDDTRLGFKIKFDPTNLFNGIHQTVDIDRSGSGRSSPFNYFGQAEIITWHILNQAGGIAGFQNDLVYFEQPRAGTGEGTMTEGSAQLVFTAYRNDYLDSAYEDGSDGKLFKFASIYATDTEHTVGGDPEGFKTNGFRFNQVYETPLRDLGDDPESYRYNYLLQNNEAEDDFSPVINLAKTFSLPQTQFNAVVDDVLDVDHFLRTAAAMSLIGATDNYFSGVNNNLQLYQNPEDGKFQIFPWDNDTQRGSVTASLVGNSDIQKVVNVSSTNLRNYLSHLNDIMQSTFNTSYMSYWINHYQGLVSANQTFGEILSYIGNRNSHVTNQLNNAVNSNTQFAITTNGGNNFTTSQNTVTIRGTGNLDVNQIRLVGSDQTLDVTWTSNTQWEVTLTEVFSEKTFTFEATRFNGDVVGSDSITITAPTNSQAQQDFLRITEFHYNPPGSGDPTEFIELTNIGTTALDVSGAVISEGPSAEFVIPNGTTLAAGQSLVIASDLISFEAAYPQVDTSLLFGPYTGGLSNSGESLTLLDSDTNVIMSVAYEDGDLWSSLADGEGASLELVDAFNTPTGELDKYFSWRASNEIGGTPGTIGAGPSGVVINEVLAHTDAPDSDTIELFNSSDSPIDISGWWLSDSTNEPLKFQIPAGTTLAAGGFVTFDESDFNPTPLNPGPNDFALSSLGDQVILSQGSGGVATHLEDIAEFGATFNGESIGRLPDGTGRLTRLASNSLGSTNGAQADSDLIISEVNYHPDTPNAAALAIDSSLTDDDLEFIEIYNTTNSAVDLTNWRLRGEADYDFLAGTSLAAGQALAVISFDPSDPANATRLDAFMAHYGLTSSNNLVGGLSQSLSNGSGRVSLQQPGTPDETEIPRVVIDEVVYDDLTPWADADGSGQSLNRNGVGTNGNLAASWTAETPTPGVSDIVAVPVVGSVVINDGSSQRSSITSLTVTFEGDVDVDADAITVIQRSDANGVTGTVVGTNFTCSMDGDGNTVLTITFTSSTRNGQNALEDGNYELKIDGTKVRRAGTDVTMAQDYVLGNSAADNFYSFYGDNNGDRFINVVDLLAFRQTFLASSGSSEYNEAMDHNRDGIVNVVDLLQFRQNFLTALPFV